MYEDAKEQLKVILGLVSQCPAELQEKCFEVLLKGYVDSKLGHTKQVQPPAADQMPPPPPPSDNGGGSANIPDAVKPRFRTTAKRLNTSLAALSDLFDFTIEPFSYHALHVPGKNKADKTRKVALLIAAKTYLTTGRWKADWGEVKAMSVDQNCYDRANIGTHLDHEYFKSASAESGIALSGAGTKAAEVLLATLAGEEDSN